MMLGFQHKFKKKNEFSTFPCDSHFTSTWTRTELYSDHRSCYKTVEKLCQNCFDNFTQRHLQWKRQWSNVISWFVPHAFTVRPVLSPSQECAVSVDTSTVLPLLSLLGRYWTATQNTSALVAYYMWLYVHWSKGIWPLMLLDSSTLKGVIAKNNCFTHTHFIVTWHHQWHSVTDSMGWQRNFRDSSNRFWTPAQTGINISVWHVSFMIIYAIL